RGAGILGVQRRFSIVCIHSRVSAIVSEIRMDLREASRGVAREPEGGTECSPVRGGEDVGVFNYDDGLALPRKALAEQRIQVVNGGQISRGDHVAIRSAICGGVTLA